MDASRNADPSLLAAWVEQSPDLLAASSADGVLLWANRRFAEAFGDTLPAQLHGQPERAAGVELQIGGHWYTVHVARAGERRLWTLRPADALHALRDEAQRLREQVDVAQEFGRLGLWERDVATGEGRWDRHVFEFWGLDPAAGTPSLETATALIHPEDRFARPYGETMRTVGRYSQHYRVMRPDGSVRRIHSQWEVKPGPDGRPQRVVGVMVDDTPIYELARSLDDASAQLKLAVELGDIAIWRHDLVSHRMYYSDRAFKVLDIEPRPEGLPIEEVRSFIHPDDLPGVLESARVALTSDRPTDMEARYRRSDGSWRHVLTRRVVQRGADGRPLAFVGVALDLTEQVEQRRRAADLARRLEIAAEAAQIGIWWRDPVGGGGEWNAHMFELTGRDRALGTPTLREWIDGIVHPEDRARLGAAPSLMLEQSPRMREHEFRVVRPDGEVRWLVTRARPEEWQGRRMVFGVTLDITERRRAETALRSADERAALAARGAGIGTWEIDIETGAEQWDEQMFRLRGLVPGPQAPTRAERLALLVPEDHSKVLDGGSGDHSSPLPARYEFRVRLPGGEIRWLASRSVAVRDAKARVVRRIGINWDITDAKTAEAAREQTAVAERANLAKSQFLARVSHELRTPLNAVLGFTQLLQLESEGDPARSARLEHIRSAGEHLLALINDVLDLSSVEAGSLALLAENVDVATLGTQALPLVASAAAEAGVTLHCGPLAGRVLADRTRLLQVLVNLLSNGIKYNRRGGEVRVSSRVQGDRVLIEVADTGRGLTEAQIEHLFEPFNRLGVEREGIAGTGIGLTIVKALLGTMRGSVDVRSRPGRGSVFTVRLPSATPDSGEATAPPPPAPDSHGQPASGQLLYIEDNPVNVLLVEELVHTVPGLRFTSAGDGDSGVQQARRLGPDLILVDMQLPDFDGYEVLRRLRGDASTAAIPCIALSANAMPEDIARALASGFADYWTKPIDLRAVQQALSTRFGAR